MTISRQNIGIAILSTDRPACLQRLLKSIADHSTTDGLSVFVVDDSENPDSCKTVTKQYPWAVFFHTGERIGIAENTNKAMWSLAEFEYKMIFNNDVEILRIGWEYYYFLAMQQTGFHHFCFQQEGLWGAGTEKRPQIIEEYYGRKVKTIHDFPQGAILALDQKAFETVGYFDASNFQSYGYSHWMWSFSVSESGIQPKGIHDVIGSNDYFRVHDEKCTTPQDERSKSYQRNGKIFRKEFEKLKKGERPVYTPY
jgi:hypothetical protein